MDEDEPARIFALYKSEMGKNQPGYRLTYTNQISNYITNDMKIKLSMDEIVKYAKDKQSWNKIVAHRRAVQ